MKAGLPLLIHPLNFSFSCAYADDDVFALENFNLHMLVLKQACDCVYS